MTNQIVRNLKARKVLLLDGPEFAQPRGGAVMNLHAVADDIQSAIDEIDRLRFTDAEREAVEKAAYAYEHRCEQGVGLENDGPHDCGNIAATLRGLLSRLA